MCHWQSEQFTFSLHFLTCVNVATFSTMAGAGSAPERVDPRYSQRFRELGFQGRFPALCYLFHPLEGSSQRRVIAGRGGLALPGGLQVDPDGSGHVFRADLGSSRNPEKEV